MPIKYNVIPDFMNKRTLTIHPGSAKRLNMQNKKRVYMRFGLHSYEVDISLSNQVGINELSLSFDAIDDFKLPLTPLYELQCTKNQVIIGPYIGILATKTKSGINETINNLTNYVYYYQKIAGVIIAFSLEGVDKKAQLIEGYLYNPQTKSWVAGFYPYPSVIFKRTSMNREWRNYFHSLIQECIFNDYLFNKWEMHSWLSQFENLKDYLPDTILYNKTSDIELFLDIYKKVYIKPIHGSQGIGVMEAVKMNSGIVVKHFKNGESKEEAFSSVHDARRFFRNHLKSGEYIVQQAVNLFNHEGRIIDFRLIILKNYHGEWENIGMVARYGRSGSIVSNVSGGGIAEIGELTLKNSFGLSDEEVTIKRSLMSKVSIDAARALEECGVNCGNLGVDLGIDVDGNIWVIEINNKDPNHTIAIDAKDRQMFYKAKFTNMLYCKRLAGFIEEDIL